MTLAQAEQALDTARREHVRLAQQREQVRAHIRGIGYDYHYVDLERGVRRNGQLIASDIQAHIKHIRTVAQQEGLSPSCLERIDKAERVVPQMQATIAFVSGYVSQQVHLYIDRVAKTRSVEGGEPLRELAKRLRTPLLGMSTITAGTPRWPTV
jgi:hypothetical protein